LVYVKVDSAVENRQSQDGRNVKAIGLVVLMFSLYFAYIGVSASSLTVALYIFGICESEQRCRKQAESRQADFKTAGSRREEAVDMHALSVQ